VTDHQPPLAIIGQLHKDHHRCVAHTLNSSIKEALNGNAKIIDFEMKKLVVQFKHDALATYKLPQSQEQMGLPLLKVKQAVDTRWTSVLLMIDRLRVLEG
jgi:5-methylcytosine-specific restriction endonuclease McrBC GTP-binding regulatory subunit McrB